eukprot:SAG11_NODE_6694_length_1265_cov_1.141509_2_plen_31_part_01
MLLPPPPSAATAATADAVSTAVSDAAVPAAL